MAHLSLRTTLMLTLLLVFCVDEYQTKDLYVDSSITEKDAPCTATLPCQSIDHAVNRSEAGDVLLLVAGGGGSPSQPYNVNDLTIKWSLTIRASDASTAPVIACPLAFSVFNIVATSENYTAGITTVSFQDVVLKTCSVMLKNATLRFNHTSLMNADLTVAARNDNEVEFLNSTANGTAIRLTGLCPDLQSSKDKTCTHSTLKLNVEDTIFYGSPSGLTLTNISEVDVTFRNVQFRSFDREIKLASTNILNLDISNMQLVDFLSVEAGFILDCTKGNLSGSIVDSFIRNNTFLSGGAVSISAGNTSVVSFSFINTHFENNSCDTAGGAINLDLSEPRKMSEEGEAIEGMLQTVLIDGCNFTLNKNGESAAAVYVAGGNVSITNSSFIENRVTTDLSISTRYAERKGAGGAIYGTSHSYMEIDGCAFINNSANWFGGAIAGNGAVLITSSHFETSKTPRATLGEFLYLSGSVRVANLTFNVSSADKNVPLIWYSSSAQGNFQAVDDGYLDFYCPVGSQFRNDTLPELKGPSYKDLFYFCDPCPTNTYSLEQGFRSGPLEAGVGNWSSDFRCLPCSYGGVCSRGKITSQFNFWGYADGQPPTVSMMMCPEGYCCQDKKCPAFDTCATDRSGMLCGQCKPGMSEKLYTTECVNDKACKDVWVFVVDITASIITVVFFLYQLEIVGLVCKYLFWADVSENDDPTFAGFIKSVFYFYQTIDLLRVQANQASQIVGVALQPLISYLLSFKSISIIFGACPFPGMTPVTKTVIKSIPTLYVLSFIGILTLISTIVSKKKKETSAYVHFQRQTSSAPVNKRSFASRLAGACLSYFLFNYISISNMTFTLLACLPFANKSVLYIDGNVQCIQPWQGIFILIAIIHVCPFFMAVIVSRYLYDHSLIGTRQFFASYFLPLPMLLYWGILYCTKWKKLKGVKIEDAMDESVNLTPKPSLSQEELMKANILGMIEEPFVNHTNAESARYWEGILIFRRMVLSAVAAFTVQPLLSITLQTLTCFGFLLWHIHVQPFGTKSANNFETVSLSILTVVAICHIIQATLLSSGIPAIGPNKTQIFITDWIEWILVNLFPMLLGLALVVFIAVRLFMLCGNAFKYLYLKITNNSSNDVEIKNRSEYASHF